MSERARENFEEDVRSSFARQGLLQTIGARLVRVAPGEVDIELPLSDRVTQQVGSVHAGAIASIADTASAMQPCR